MKRQRFFRREDLGCKLQSPKRQESNTAGHLCAVKSCSCIVTKLLQSKAEPGPPVKKCSCRNQSSPTPPPQEPEDPCGLQLPQYLFGNACFCFLNRRYSRSSQQQLGWVPSRSSSGGLGEERRRPGSLSAPVLQGGCSEWKRVVSEPCHVFT